MSNELPEKAIEAEKEATLELFSLNEEQSAELKKRIEKFHGLVRIFIHPDTISPDEYSKQFLGFVMTISSENSPPIIFLEDHNHVEGFKEDFELMRDKLPNPIYFAETLPRFPYPIFPGDTVPNEIVEFREMPLEQQKNAVKGMRTLAIILRNLGVKKVLVGGANLEIDDSDRLQECVGNFVESFNMCGESDFDIKVSNLTIPKNRNDLRGVRDKFL